MIRSNDAVIFVRKTSKEVENLYRGIAWFDMSYDVNDERCRGTWEDEDDTYFHVGRSKMKNDGKIVMGTKQVIFYWMNAANPLKEYEQDVNLYEKKVWLLENF